MPSFVPNMKNSALFTRPLFSPECHTSTPSQNSSRSEVSHSVQHPSARLMAISARESPLTPISISSAAACLMLRSFLTEGTMSWFRGLNFTTASLPAGLKFTFQLKLTDTSRGLAPLSNFNSDILYESHS